ncbi:MAG: DNA-binding response regulator [Rhodocyclales bacterium GT-UBC]|nr:MAG: DNA-binding response regulator [Rhodocyclales bacterium GT-UBC]
MPDLPMPRFLVADDHPLIRDSMQALLQRVPLAGACRVELADNADVLWQACERTRFDLVLLDLQMPGMAARGGLDAYIKTWLPHQPTALFSGHVTERIQREFRLAGGRGVLHKTHGAPLLLGAIQIMLAGSPYFPERVEATAGESPDVSVLSGRQREIYDLLLRGLSNKAIAKELGLTLGTVKNHVHELYQRLRVSNRFEALANGLSEKSG